MNKIHKLKRKTKITIVIFIVLLLFSIFFLPDFLMHQNNDLEVSYYTIHSAKIPTSFKDYKIVFLSDLHISEGPLSDRVVDQCRALNPDIIVISGDIVESSLSEQDYYESSVATFAKKLITVSPVYWVTGNYEASLSSTNFSTLKRNLAASGFIFLDNKSLPLIKGKQIINLCGIKDPLFGVENRISSMYDDVAAIKSYLSEALPQNMPSVFTILLAHRTEYCELIAESHVDLLLTGHAHGGQIRLPLIGAVFAPGQGFFPKYTAGQFTIKNTQLVVSRGIGASRIKQRLFNQPEIILLTLQPPSS
ncbi:MAG: metallophosphoesterase [Clostridia bacterium]